MIIGIHNKSVLATAVLDNLSYRTYSYCVELFGGHKVLLCLNVTICKWKQGSS